MPAKKPSRRTVVDRERCAYMEGGQRCQRNGTGNPPLCTPHKIAVAEAAAATSRPFGHGIADLIDRVVNGRKINRQVLEGVLDDVAWWATVGAAQYQQEQADQPGSGPFRPPPNFRPPPGWNRPQQQPDPKIEARRRARRVMGFGDESLTVDVVKKRHRELARKFHPDRGGSVVRMQEINASVDVLLADPQIQ